MRACEFLVESSIDESPKQQLAGLGLTAAALLGINKGIDHINQPTAADAAKSAVGAMQQDPQQATQKYNKDTVLKSLPGKDKIQNPTANIKVEIPKGASELEKLLAHTAIKSGIKGMELVQFMAQNAHESWNFTKLAEVPKSTNYFAKRYDIKFNPEKAKILGNIKPGDGEKYKGRGFIQITGRWNYKRAEEALGLPLEQKPELAEKPEIAAKIAVWFWKHRVQPNVSDWQDVEQVTKPINPNLRGIDDREQKFYQFQQKYIKKA